MFCPIGLRWQIIRAITAIIGSTTSWNRTFVDSTLTSNIPSGQYGIELHLCLFEQSIVFLLLSVFVLNSLLTLRTSLLTVL